MDANKILKELQVWAPESIGSLTEPILNQLIMAVQAVLIVVLVVGLLWSLFGLKLIRVWSAILGLILGFSLGTGIALGFAVEMKYALIIGAVSGLVLACLWAILYRVGIFFVTWIAASCISASVLPIFFNQNWQVLLICAIIGLVLAILSIKFPELVTILVTGLAGAGMTETAIAGLVHFEQGLFPVMCVAVVAILGILIQFSMESTKRKKHNLKKADAIRKEKSAENEVKKARALFDDLENMSDDDEYDDAEYDDAEYDDDGYDDDEYDEDEYDEDEYDEDEYDDAEYDDDEYDEGEYDDDEYDDDEYDDIWNEDGIIILEDDE